MKYILGFYSQLPHGTSSEDYEALLSNKIKPLLTTIYKNPSYKVVMRLGINIYEYFESKHPEINMLICDLCRKNQLELLCSTYYDSIVTFSSAHERTFQIEKSITYIRKHFQKRPTGLWLYNQVFNPCIIPIMEKCSLDYVCISTYNQLFNKNLLTKPFYMNELGAYAAVFPTDDKFSKELADGNEKEISDSITKLAKNTVNAIDTIMINLDQLNRYPQSVNKIINVLLEEFGNKSICPSDFLKDHEILKLGYLPDGLYGRDYSIGKSTSINDLILSNTQSSRFFGMLNMLRDTCKSLKKNDDLKDYIDNAFNKAQSCSSYFPQYVSNPSVKNFISSNLCNIEYKFAEKGILPSQFDTDGDRKNEYIVFSKNIYYINSKGGTISHLNVLNTSKDLLLHDDIGLYGDALKEDFSQNTIDLTNKRYEITSLDKKNLDFYASCPNFEINKSSVSLSKRYKFRLNSLITDVIIENLSNNKINNYSYETCFNFALTDNVQILNEKNEILNDNKMKCEFLSISGRNLGYKLSLMFNDVCNVQRKDVYKDGYYQYSKIFVYKNVKLEQLKEDIFSIVLKIEK